MINSTLVLTVAKVLAVTFFAALLWRTIDPWSQDITLAEEFFAFSRYWIHAVIALWAVKGGIFIMARFKWLPIAYAQPITFFDIYFAILVFQFFFWLLWVPYGPYLGLFDFLGLNQ